MKILISNIFAEVSGAKPEEIDKLYDVLAYELIDKDRIREYKLSDIEAKLNRPSSRDNEVKLMDDLAYWRNWDGKVHLFNKKRMRFPAGLWYVVLGLYPKAEVEGNFRLPVKYKETGYTGSINLFDFQKKIVEEVIEYDGRCIINLATGGGKTEIAIWLMSIFEVKALIIVPNATLEKQWIERMKKYYNMEQTDMSRVYQIDNKGVFMVATRSYVHNCFFGRAKGKQAEYEVYRIFMKDVGAVFYDESHHAASKQSEEILQNIDAYYRIGLTGTTDMRADGTDIIYHGYLGPNVGNITQEDLIGMNRATEPTIVFRAVGQRSFPRHRKYAEIVDEYIVNNDHRNSLLTAEARKLVREGRKVLVLTDRVQHITILEAIMRLDEEIGGQVVGVHANSPHREEAFEKWMKEDEETMVMICTVQLVGEGFDFPNLGGMVLAGTWKSKTRSIQTLGR